MIFGERIHYLRDIRNLTVQELAVMLSITDEDIIRWENNEAVPSIRECIKLCDVLKVSLDELCGRYDIFTQYNKQDAIAYGVSQYDRETYQVSFKVVLKKAFIRLVMGTVILTGLGCILIYLRHGFWSVIPFFPMIFLLIRLWALRKGKITEPDSYLQNNPNLTLNFRFYTDHIDLMMHGDNGFGLSAITYEDVKKVIETDTYLYLQINNRFYIIEKSTIQGNKTDVLHLLNLI